MLLVDERRQSRPWTRVRLESGEAAYPRVFEISKLQGRASNGILGVQLAPSARARSGGATSGAFRNIH
jgi:hypothetical protein